VKNTLITESFARQPRGLVKINGEPVDGWMSWEVDSNSFYQADVFNVTWAIEALPKGFGADFWASVEKAEVEIFAGFPSDPESFGSDALDSLIVGKVDDVAIDLTGRTIGVTGRDLSGDLIDTKSSAKFPNLTSSQIVQKIAAAHGLTAVVKPTGTKAGRFYQIDRVRLQNDETEWDMLTYLAREEGYSIFMQGRELHFEPLPTATQDPYVVRYSPPAADGSSASASQSEIKVSRNLTLARDVRVTVKSWNSKSKKAFEKVFQFKRVRNPLNGKAGSPSSPAQEYSYVIPGLTPEQALQRAEQIARDITAHELKLSIDGPADNLLRTTDVLSLDGTGTALDQIFYPASIVRSFDASSGYHWRIEAKNHSPETEPTL
jgi:phage protein D